MPRHLVPLLPFSLSLPACSPKIRPAQIFPGFESAPTDRLATLRESDSIYIHSIDRRNAPERDNMLVGRTPYREFQIPAGVHLIAVYYSSPEISSVSSLVARIQAGHTYSFDSKVETNYFF